MDGHTSLPVDQHPAGSSHAESCLRDSEAHGLDTVRSHDRREGPLCGRSELKKWIERSLIDWNGPRGYLFVASDAGIVGDERMKEERHVGTTPYTSVPYCLHMCWLICFAAVVSGDLRYERLVMTRSRLSKAKSTNHINHRNSRLD